MKTSKFLKTPAGLALLAGCLLMAGETANAQPVVNFPFNEGSGSYVNDTANSLKGRLGTFDPAVDKVTITDFSPSGAAGDRSVTNAGLGFLVVDDSVNPVLNLTNGPITIETWLYLDPSSFAKLAEGLVGYGNSYKMGMRGGYQVFTLFGAKDITNSIPEDTRSTPVPAGRWVHLAAAWDPGVGVHFYMDGVETFVEYTNTATARPAQNNWLGIMSEGTANNTLCAMDRVRIHHALLTAAQLDSDAANPKPALASTVVAYNFNETALPAQSAVSPARPAEQAAVVLEDIGKPAWTNDTPSGLPGDYALAFLDLTSTKDFIEVPYADGTVNLGANNTNYTLQAWIKLPTTPFEERRVIYRTQGTGPRVALSINANRTLHTTLYGNADFTSSVVVPNDGKWHHVAAVMEDFARVRFYLDGILRQTTDRTKAPVTSAQPANLLIGKESETRFFNGLLDRVIIHNVALTNSTLDFPAIPGLPVFPTLEAHPTATNVNLGDSVVFTAAPASGTAMTYQWYYRTNLADAQGVAIQGATSATLPVNNIAAKDFGYYSVVVSNSVGRVESYRARLALVPPPPSAPPFTFEAPTYTSGPLSFAGEGQDGWSNDLNDGAVQVLTADEIAAFLTDTGRAPGQTVHGGSQALLVSGFGLASTSIRQVAGFDTEQNVTLDVWVRPVSETSTNPIGNVFLTMENSGGTRAAAVRLGPALSIDYGSAITGVWKATGLTADTNKWTNIKMVLDYSARTYDFYVDGVQVNTSPIPFYTATADKFQQIRIFRGSNQAGMIVDDLKVIGPAASPSLGIRKTATGYEVFWPATDTGYTLESAAQLPATSWTGVSYSTVGSENVATISATGNSQFYRLRK